DDILESALRTERLAEPVQTKRTIGHVARGLPGQAERVVDRPRTDAVPRRVFLGDHRTARGGEPRVRDDIALDSRGERVGELAPWSALLAGMKVFEVDGVRHPQASGGLGHGRQGARGASIYKVRRPGGNFVHQFVVDAAGGA